jgi:hypothetical protein
MKTEANKRQRGHIGVSVVGGGIVGLFIGVGVLSAIGRASSGTPDGAALGMLGFFVGPPIGAFVGLIVGLVLDSCSADAPPDAPNGPVLPPPFPDRASGEAGKEKQDDQT